MANELDELNGPVNEEGRDANVINKQLKIEVGGGTKFFVGFCCVLIFGIFAKINAEKKLQQLQQRIQNAASQIDNYMEQRVVILQNAAGLVKKAIDLDKTTFTEIAKLRAGGSENFTEQNEAIENVAKKINVALESYPDLKAHAELADAMQQNSYTQREITAARDLYNDVIDTWNRTVYEWPFLRYVAAKKGYTTRVPFIASAETKAKARGNFFEN